MNLHLEHKIFLVGGATSGLGKANVSQLIDEDAKVSAIARTESKLTALHHLSDQIQIAAGDLSKESVLDTVLAQIG